MHEGISGDPKLGPHDTESRQSLWQLCVYRGVLSSLHWASIRPLRRVAALMNSEVISPNTLLFIDILLLQILSKYFIVYRHFIGKNFVQILSCL